MNHRVEFSPEALGDLIDLYDYIAAREGAGRAIGYIDRIAPDIDAVDECCRGLSVLPDRGAARDDRRAMISAQACAFSVSSVAP